MQFVPELLIFTCNKDPQAWYDWTNCAHPMGALIRRITNQWCYVKVQRPEWGNCAGHDENGDITWHSFALRERGAADFHPARKCMHFIKTLPGGEDLYGFAKDPEVGNNVVEENADKYFV